MSNDWESPANEILLARNSPPFGLIDTGATPGFTGSKSDGADLLLERGEHLAGLQEKLFAQGRSGDVRSVLLVLQGMDTAGKGGIVRHVMGQVDPQGVWHASFGKPTEEELSHDFLWRIRNKLPPAGQIGVFDRSHYEDVLVVRVHDLVPEPEWRGRYEIINDFEKELTEAGTTVIKCALCIGPDEQKARLAKRLDRPDKYWKFNPADIDERVLWPEYQAAYQEAIDKTDTDHAPWYLIPADHKWFARLAISELLIAALEKLDLDWPSPDFDVEAEKARLAET